MESSTTKLWLIFNLIIGINIHAQNPIGFRPFATYSNLILGTEAPIPYLIGNADEGGYFSNLSKNYQLIVPSSAFMPTHTWFGENEYNFTETDWLLGATPNSTGWVQQNGMLVRAHALIWGKDYRVPNWLLNQEESITPDKAKSLLSDFIHTIVSRYRGKIHWWNVINEAGSDHNETSPFNLGDSFWYRKLGPDFIKYAFIFAREADPDVKLYYNEYNIEKGGVKANGLLALISWLKSEGVSVDGVGMQWHISVSEVITPGDDHYQIAQRFIDLNISLTISELDVAIQTKGAFPLDPNDLEKQATIYRSLLQYVFHFSPHIPALTTWGFTDRYSYIPVSSNYTKGVGLPLDCQYQPKPAYWELLEEFARVLVDGIYRLSPKSQPEKCLGTYDNGTTVSVQLYTGNCNNTNQKWNVTWLGDGTYRFSPQNILNSTLYTYNTTASIGGVGIWNWTGDFNQEWALNLQGNDTYRIAPRPAWWRVLAVDTTSNIVISNYTNDDSQQWVLTLV